MSGKRGDPPPLRFEGFEVRLDFRPTDTALRRHGNPTGLRGVAVDVMHITTQTVLSLALHRGDVRALRDFCNQWLQAHDDETPPAPEAA